MNIRSRMLKVAKKIISDWLSKDDYPVAPSEGGPWHETPKGWSNIKLEGKGKRKNITETEEKDFFYGYQDAKGGFYDKWYRKNRKDSGAAYDAGFNKAKNDGKHSKNGIQIIDSI